MELFFETSLSCMWKPKIWFVESRVFLVIVLMFIRTYLIFGKAQDVFILIIYYWGTHYCRNKFAMKVHSAVNALSSLKLINLGVLGTDETNSHVLPLFDFCTVKLWYLFSILSLVSALQLKAYVHIFIASWQSFCCWWVLEEWAQSRL